MWQTPVMLVGQALEDKEPVLGRPLAWTASPRTRTRRYTRPLATSATLF